MREVVIVEGYRTPFARAWTVFNRLPAQELGRLVVSEMIQRLDMDPSVIDEVIFGNIATPAEAANIARVIALMSRIPEHVPAYTVSRNCASGMESIAHAYYKIREGEADVIIAGGVESMSNIPLIFQKDTADLFTEISRAKTLGQRLKGFLKFRLRHFKPIIGLQVGLTDGFCGLNMGQTAEVLAREFMISRQEQDEFALMSHQRATKATEEGKLREEIIPVYVPPTYEERVDEDNGIRKNQSLEALAKLRPVFDRHNGTITAGNASQLTDGAAAVVVMSYEKARELGYQPLGFIRGYSYAGLDPSRMGLGPSFAVPKLLKKTKVQWKDIQLLELNEAFAAQVIANERAFRSREFAQRYLGQSKPIGEINREILNVNGGAIALGHPVGASGARLVITLLKEMRRRNLELGLVTLCVGGGQGAAMLLERK